MTIINLSYNDRKNHTLSEYSKFEEFLHELSREIDPNLENSIRYYLNKTLEFYKYKLEKSIEQELEAISKLKSELTDVEN